MPINTERIKPSKDTDIENDNIHLAALNTTVKELLNGQETDTINICNVNINAEQVDVVDRRVRKKLASIRQYSKEHKAIYVDKYANDKNKNSKLLVVSESITIKPHHLIPVPVRCQDSSLENKLWSCSPVKKYRAHEDIHIFDSLIDKDHSSIMVHNTSTGEITFSSGTCLATAFEINYMYLPYLDEGDDLNIDFLCPDIAGSSPVSDTDEENLSPRAKALRDYNEVYDASPPRVQEFLKPFKNLFVPKHEYLHSGMNIEPVKLPTKEATWKPTPPLAKRRYSAEDEAAIDAWMEVSLMNNLIKPIQSPITSALHCVRRNGKTRIQGVSRFF